MSIYEYDEEAVMQALQQEARELGRKEGFEQGFFEKLEPVLNKLIRDGLYISDTIRQ